MKTEKGQFHDCQKPQKLQERPWPDSLYYFSVSMTKYEDERQPKEQRAYSDLGSGGIKVHSAGEPWQQAARAES